MKTSIISGLPVILTLFSLSVDCRAQSDLTGDWKGLSICQDKGSACRDEEVVYHVRPENSSGQITIDADKIVAGKVINMGELIFIYDKTKNTLTSANGSTILTLTVKGKNMEGTMVRNGALFRKITLTKQ